MLIRCKCRFFLLIRAHVKFSEADNGSCHKSVIGKWGTRYRNQYVHPTRDNGGSISRYWESVVTPFRGLTAQMTNTQRNGYGKTTYAPRLNVLFNNNNRTTVSIPAIFTGNKVCKSTTDKCTPNDTIDSAYYTRAYRWVCAELEILGVGISRCKCVQLVRARPVHYLHTMEAQRKSHRWFCPSRVENLRYLIRFSASLIGLPIPYNISRVNVIYCPWTSINPESEYPLYVHIIRSVWNILYDHHYDVLELCKFLTSTLKWPNLHIFMYILRIILNWN